MPLVQWTGRSGEPLYQCQPPTGYADNVGGFGRIPGAVAIGLSFSLALRGIKCAGRGADVGSLLGAGIKAMPRAALNRALQVFLGGRRGSTVGRSQKQLENPQIVGEIGTTRLGAWIWECGGVGFFLGAPEVSEAADFKSRRVKVQE